MQEAIAVAEAANGRVCAVVDLPNLNCCARRALGSQTSINVLALNMWITQRAAGGRTCMTVFTNVWPGQADSKSNLARTWLAAGISVLLKTKHDGRGDIDGELVAHVRNEAGQPGLAHIILASADGRRLRPEIAKLMQLGARVTVAAFRESSAWASTTSDLTVIDLRDVEGVVVRS